MQPYTRDLTEQESDALTCARRGIQWLDSNLPNWRTTIEVADLDMSDSHSCALGQATDLPFQTAANFYHLDMLDDCIKLGFNCPIPILKIGTEYGTHGYEELNWAWKSLLGGRS